MKAVILAAGEGTRLRPLTITRPKHVLPIAGKPLLEHTLEALKKSGISEVLIVVGYLKEKIFETLGTVSYTHLTLHDLLCVDLGGRRIIKKKKT